MIYAIGDLHLALSAPKPMDIFRGWDGYMEKLEQSWRQTVTDTDTVVVAGDVSWAMKLTEAEADFSFLESLPGRKLLMKGNHDYWWSTRSRMESQFEAFGLKSLQILHNSAVLADGVALCGSRGWMFENGESHDRKIVEREAGRIAMSLKAAEESSSGTAVEKLLFLHYPPIFGNQVIPEFFDVMEQYGVKRCYYGHLHGPALHEAFCGSYRGVQLSLISADYLGFAPLRINIAENDS
ncbi:MAG: metallophosphoesterase [Angelakisella sp.]